MHYPRFASLLLGVTVLAVALAACSGSASASLTDVPVFAGAEPVEASANFLTDAMVRSIQQSVAAQDLTAEINLYRLPKGTTWEAVKQFYTTGIGDVWQAAPEVTQETGVINFIGWQRGSGASEQMLIAGQAEDATSGTTFLLLGLFSE